MANLAPQDDTSPPLACMHAYCVQHYLMCIIERFQGTIFCAKIRMGSTDFFQACSIRFFRHGESARTGFHTNHVSYGDFASSGAERFFAYTFCTRNIDFRRVNLISVQIFKIKSHSAGMRRVCDRNLGTDGKHISSVHRNISLLENDV